MQQKNSLYYNGLHYDLRYNVLVEDIPFLVKFAKMFGEKVLELMCGTGRIAIPLAQEKLEVTGIDISPSMLNQARRKAEKNNTRIEFIEADCRYFSLEKKFDVVIVPFNSFTHLVDRSSVELCLSCVKKHLSENGKFILDYLNPSLTMLMKSHLLKEQAAIYPSPLGNGNVNVKVSSEYNPATQINDVRWYYQHNGDENEFTEEVKMRIYFPQELDELLHYNGFTIENKFGNYDESPFVSSSPKQLFLCSVKK